MTEQAKQAAFEAKKRRWYVGGALAAMAVVAGGLGALAVVDEPAPAPVERVFTTVPPPVLEKKAEATVETVQDPPAKGPVFPEVPEEKLALAHEDDGEVDHLAKAEEAEKIEDFDTMVTELRAQLVHTPQDTEVMWKLAKNAHDEVSEKALQELLKVAPKDAEAAKELARRHLDANDPKGAYPFAVEATKREATGWEAWQLKGRALMGQDKLAAAILAFKKSTEQAGAPSFPYNNLGYALLLAGRPAEALVALDSAVDRGPVTAFMMNNLGLAYERLGRLDEAEVAFLGALELKSDYVKANVNLQRVGLTKELIAKQEEEERAAEAKDAESQAAAGEAAPEGTPVPTEHVEPGPLHGG